MSFETDPSGFHRMWAHQLRMEHEAICWQYGITLKPPIFEISSSRSRYGSWNPAEGVLEISQVLIRKYPWDTVLNVLKHEMAHQICSDIFRDPKAGHGRTFRRACNLIGLDHRFRNSSGDLAEGVTQAENPSPHTREVRRFMEKIRKLLALARSGNEHEANLAMAKAGAIMEKYNLKVSQVEEQDGYAHVIINHRKKRLERHHRHIAGILRDFFYVYVVFTDTYDPELLTEFRVIDIMGRKENVEVAEFVYHFLDRKIRSLWLENRHRFRGNGLRARNSYYLGLLMGFRDKLEAQHRSGTKDAVRGSTKVVAKTGSVMAVEADQGLQRFISMRYPRLRTYSSSGARVYGDSYRQGIEDGKKIVINKAVHSHGENSGLALED